MKIIFTIYIFNIGHFHGKVQDKIHVFPTLSMNSDQMLSSTLWLYRSIPSINDCPVGHKPLSQSW